MAVTSGPIMIMVVYMQWELVYACHATHHQDGQSALMEAASRVHTKFVVELVKAIVLTWIFVHAYSPIFCLF